MSASEPESESLVGCQLSHYAVTRQIGAGGMGVVYLATDTRLDRPVAIKVLGHEFTQDARHRERLRREARAAAGLIHPNIATVYALEEVDDSLFIVSEYVEGQTLRVEVARGPASVGVVLDTAVEIARALAFAHDHGVIHRDLKPENVIRTPVGAVKVLDFGLARLTRPDDLAATRLTDYGMVLGTPGYIPPEQLRGRDVDYRADIFALGVVLYELTSGAHPFTSSTAASTITRVLEVDPPDIVQLNASCPPALDRLVRRCLQKEPARRWGSTREVTEALEAIRRDAAGGRGRPRARPPAPAGGPLSSPLWWWQVHQVVVGVLYCLMLIPLWLVRERDPGPWGSLVFFGAVVAVGIGATLRFHLWFVSRFNRGELEAQREQVANWVRVADVVFVGLLLAAGALTAAGHAAMATLLIAVAVGSGLAFQFIEPATTRAAFRRRRSSAGRQKSDPGRSTGPAR